MFSASRDRAPARLTFALFAALCFLPREAAVAEPLRGPTRPLPEASHRPVPAGTVPKFVDATRGDDTTGDGSRDRPWRSPAHAFAKLAPGDTLVLRGGTYYEHATLAARGTADRPITVRAFPGELVTIDGGIADFARDPASAWEPVPDGAPGEFRSTKAYPGLDAGRAGDGDGDGASHVFGHFADTMVPLQAYRFRADLRSDNPYWNVREKTQNDDAVYCGPGVWYDASTGRIHCRLQHTKLPGLGDDNYRGPTDPRGVRLVLAGRRDRAPLRIADAGHVRLQDLVLRGAAGPALLIENASNVELDGLHVFGGASGITAKSVRGLRVAHTAIRGIAAPWTFRGSLKYRSVEARLFSSGSWAPTGDDSTDFEFQYCEFTDSVDGVFVGSVRRVRMSHCLLDNVSDDGIFLTANTGYDGHTHGGDVRLTRNVFSRCLTTFAFGVGHGRQKATAGGARQVGAGVRVARNVFDFRRPVNYYWPTGPDAPQEITSRGRFAGDHGSPAWEPMRVYHNTILAGDAPRYDYITDGLGRAVVPGTSRRVFNNVVLQAIGQPGGTLPQPAADFAADGNLYWTADTTARAKGDPLDKFRKSPIAGASKEKYPPGWCGMDRWADPLLTAYDADFRKPVRIELTAGSPAVDTGVALAADEFPDSLAGTDPKSPDRGAIPLGHAGWRVGLKGRLSHAGTPLPAPLGDVGPVGWELPPVPPADIVRPPLARAAIFTGYPAFDAPILSYLLKRQRTTVDLFHRTFPDPAKWAGYDLIAVDGSMARAKLERTAFAKDDFPRIKAWLEAGGTLLLMRERIDLFAGDARPLLESLTGPIGRGGKQPAHLANTAHPWTAHLAEARSAENWMGKLNVSPLALPKADAPLTAGRDAGAPAVLCRVPVGKGQLIYVGWSPAAAIPHGREKSTVELESAFEAQVEVLRHIATNPPARP
ncbi:MAG TPA: hypothetical protein VEA69_01975 [Tepidisphaeraceae bacterium]|nr:hypothetical protein [Tepidisphaeraceae bacterium]